MRTICKSRFILYILLINSDLRNRVRVLSAYSARSIFHETDDMLNHGVKSLQHYSL